ncbi:UNVERIFIED_CONTAM: hypothetical protein Sindi_1457400, partial [Sesamum indicum]
ELSPTLLETIKQIIVAASRITGNFSPCLGSNPSDIGALEEVDPAPPAPAPIVTEALDTLMQSQSGDVPPQSLALLKCAQKGLQNVQYQ